MKRTIAALTLGIVSIAFFPIAHAAESVGDKAVEAKRSAGAGIRKAGRAAKATGRKVRQAVITRCADGRHTVKGKSGCVGHGGVNDPK